MLKEVERDPSAFIQRDDFAVYKGALWELLTGMGDLSELVCEEVFSPGPERYLLCISPGKTAVAVELNLVEPFLLREVLNQPGIHRLDKPDFGGRQCT